MTLKETIVNDKNTAMKNGESVAKLLLITTLGELDRKSKTPSDEEVIAVVKKMKTNCEECGNLEEAAILERYLPKMMSNEEIHSAIFNFCNETGITEKKDMGRVMGHLKATYPGLYDGKVASSTVNTILQ